MHLQLAHTVPKQSPGQNRRLR